MKRAARQLILAAVLGLALGAPSRAGESVVSREEAEAAVRPMMLEEEIVCRVVDKSQIERAFREFAGTLQVDLCTADERRGGRRFRVSKQADTIVVEAEGVWVECEYADPILQVRVVAPIEVAVAHRIASAVVPKLKTGETLIVISGHEEHVVENGSVSTLAVENTYDIRTRNAGPGFSGRIFKVFLGSEELEVSYAGDWMF